MADIVLTTLNARYAHASFGLRYLMANLGALRDRAALVEFDIKTSVPGAVEKILAHEPKIVGVGAYIWNASQSLQLVTELKRQRPRILIVVGGPEVSYEVDDQEICRQADYVICGEGDLEFRGLCEKVLTGGRPLMRVIRADPPEFSNLVLPYNLYNEEDVAHRVIYVEASRGCPFKCEFCLSSLDVPVRNAPLDEFLSAMQTLLETGVRHFKFVDRTFNLNLKFSRSILEFFLERYQPGLFLHFEMIPDRLPEALREPIRAFPPGALQFEVGVQTFNERVAELISRKQDNRKLEDNLRWLRAETGVHVHTDLIVGLPGEDPASFGRGFDRLVALRPQEIQVGMLKRLRGTPIVRHDREWGMVYSERPPYEILETNLIDRPMMERLRRFARYWDLVANSGNFIETAPLIWGSDSPFESFLSFSDWLYERIGRTHSIALHQLAEAVFVFLVEVRRCERERVAPLLWSDYSRGARRDVPAFLRSLVDVPSRAKRLSLPPVPRRQARHLIG